MWNVECIGSKLVPSLKQEEKQRALSSIVVCPPIHRALNNPETGDSLIYHQTIFNYLIFFLYDPNLVSTEFKRNRSMTSRSIESAAELR